MPDRMGLSTRLAALAIDLAGLALVAMLFAPWLGVRLGLDVYQGGGPGAGGLMAGVAAGTLLVGLLWFLPEALWGASVGKAVLGLRIGSADGRRPMLAQTLLRWALKTLPLWLDFLARVVALGLPRVGSVLGAIAYLLAAAVAVGGFLALRPARQALYDWVADTAVYRREALIAPGPE